MSVLQERLCTAEHLAFTILTSAFCWQSCVGNDANGLYHQSPLMAGVLVELVNKLGRVLWFVSFTYSSWRVGVRAFVLTRQRCPARGWRAGNNPAVQREERGPACLRWSVCRSGLSESPQPSHPTETNEEAASFNMTRCCYWDDQVEQLCDIFWMCLY